MLRIIVDSSADLTAEELKEKNIELLPLNVLLDGKTYQDGVNLERNQFYELLTSCEDFPKTSQPSPEAFINLFEDAKEKGDDLILILLSSGLSGTYQTAFMAKNMVEYDKVHIIDSLTATHMIHIMADYADKLRKEGLSAVEIVEKVEAIKLKVQVLAAVDTMEYLYRGGRVNKATAAIGELAKIKPIIRVNEEGKVVVTGKCLGKNKALRFIIDNLKNKNLNPDFPLYSVYTYGTENCEKLEEKMEKEGFVIKDRYQVGSSIGAHIGPGVFGIFFVEA